MLKYYHLPKKEMHPQNKYHQSKIICPQAVLLHGTRGAGKSWNGATFLTRGSGPTRAAQVFSHHLYQRCSPHLCGPDLLALQNQDFRAPR